MTLLLATFALWIGFIIFATLKEKVLDKDYHIAIKVPAYAFGIAFLVGDVGYNYTFGSVLFWELASRDRVTLTKRLRHILHSGLYLETSWRFKRAHFMCKYMIEPWDLGHCALKRLINNI